MLLSNITLEKWLEKPPIKSFAYKRRVEYFAQYQVIKNYLIQNVYDEIARAANFNDIEPLIYYNDHGLSHVDTVIIRATELVKFDNFELNAKEVYFLLCAILIHDIGNIYGRKNHEKRIGDVISHIITIFSTDTAEQKVIAEIAGAHGGRTNRDSKDTISEILIEKQYGYEKVRTRLLSSILRLADELADDRSRASKTMLMNNQLTDSPSEVFHAFSLCLDSVLIKHKENAIFLQFNIPVDFLKRKFKKFDSEIFIIDEIFNRVQKMHLENIYCQKYISRYIHLNKIEVNINFINPFNNPFDKEQQPPLCFSLENKGYPEISNNGIYSICPDLSEGEIKKDGQYFYNKFQDL